MTMFFWELTISLIWGKKRKCKTKKHKMLENREEFKTNLEYDIELPCPMGVFFLIHC